jgi:hypothetical protein
MNEKSTRSGSVRQRGSSHGKSRATLRVIEGGALKSASEHGYAPSEVPGLAREVQGAFNYCVYFCARWIGRMHRHRLEATARS